MSKYDEIAALISGFGDKSDINHPMNFMSGGKCPKCGLKKWTNIYSVVSECFSCGYRAHPREFHQDLKDEE